eukprot:7611475-Ditylum_brightwellii.AAC.1
MDQEEILEVLENGIPILWKFQMDKEGLMSCVRYKECELATSEMLVAACKHPLERERKGKTKCMVEENYNNWEQAPQQHHMDGS